MKSQQSIAIIEISFVVLTALGKFLFYDILNQQLAFILIMFAFWSTYIVRRVKKEPKTLEEWGFRTDNFREVCLNILPFGLIIIGSSFVIGYYQGTLNLHWHIIPILILYPIFGTLQQFLLMALFAGNLQSLKHFKNLPIIVITSILFGLLHYPYWWLVLGTFVLALLYSFIFLSQRNLYALGIFHGWLGGIFYFTVVDQDPFIEVFGFLL